MNPSNLHKNSPVHLYYLSSPLSPKLRGIELPRPSAHAKLYCKRTCSQISWAVLRAAQAPITRKPICHKNLALAPYCPVDALQRPRFAPHSPVFASIFPAGHPQFCEGRRRPTGTGMERQSKVQGRRHRPEAGGWRGKGSSKFTRRWRVPSSKFQGERTTAGTLRSRRAGTQGRLRWASVVGRARGSAFCFLRSTLSLRFRVEACPADSVDLGFSIVRPTAGKLAPRGCRCFKPRQGRLRVATGASPWTGCLPFPILEPRQGRLNHTFTGGHHGAYLFLSSRPHRFQEGYGAFSVSPSNTDAVMEYIRGQEEHHRRITFEEEFIALLARHGIAHDAERVWG